MAGEGIIMATPEELRRLHVIQKVLEEGLKQVEAAEILCLSSRHIRRVVKRIKQEGHRGIVHRSRGRPSNRKIPDQLKDKVIKLYRTTYKDFGPTLASEKLLERDGVGISDETLRSWLLEAGDWKRVRKGRRHRQWRERKGHRGEMVQSMGLITPGLKIEETRVYSWAILTMPRGMFLGGSMIMRGRCRRWTVSSVIFGSVVYR